MYLSVQNQESLELASIGVSDRDVDKSEVPIPIMII